MAWLGPVLIEAIRLIGNSITCWHRTGRLVVLVVVFSVVALWVMRSL